MEYRNIFICCRKDAGDKLGEALADTLRQRRYTVYSGAAMENIADTTDFLLILTPGCMSNIDRESDWLRMQIEAALREHRNIVPILADGFQFPAELPASIEPLRSRRSIRATGTALGISIDNLCNNYLESEPRKTYTKLIVSLVILLILLLGLFLFRNQLLALIIPRATLSGVVTDAQTGDPIEGVLISGEEKTAQTDENGAYKMVVKPGDLSLVYTHEGYEEKRVDYTLARNEEGDGSVALSDGKGYLSGKVTNSADESPLAGAVVRCGDMEATTDVSGAYSLYLEAGEYALTASAEGYQDASETVQIEADAYRNLNIALSSGEGTITGTVINAVTGEALSGVRVTIGEASASTDASGAYNLRAAEGSHTLQFALDGFISKDEEIDVRGGATSTCDVALSPEMASDQYRIVLTWGSRPFDLDSHLITATQHIYFSEKTSATSDARLDLDDRDGFGPETTTFTMQPGETYVFYVHDYDNRENRNSAAMAGCGAKVEIYNGNTLLNTCEVPSTGTGVFWRVFTLRDGQLTYGSTLQSDRPGLYD